MNISKSKVIKLISFTFILAAIALPFLPSDYDTYPTPAKIERAKPKELKTVHISSPGAHIDVHTKKVIRIDGEIDKEQATSVIAQDAVIHNMKGDIYVIINSRGGMVYYGQRILDVLLAEKKENPSLKLICIVDKEAMSMAFNTMSFCDTRLATQGSMLLAHKIRVTFQPGEMVTAKKMRDLSVELDAMDEMYARQNAKAMKISRQEYNVIADEERMWTALELYLTGYIDGMATIQ